MRRSEAQKRARRNYEKKCRKLQITIYPTERALSERIDEAVNNEGYTRSGYIKDLIYKDIARKKKP